MVTRQPLINCRDENKKFLNLDWLVPGRPTQTRNVPMTGGVSVSLSGLSVLKIATDDGATCGILLDCAVRRPKMTDVDVVLLSQPDIDHMHGLVPLFGSEESGADETEEADAVRRRRPTLLMTNAAIPLATMAFYSMLLGATETEHELKTEDVDRAFKRATGLRYREEHVVVSSESLTVTATPYNSGRMVGGAIWRIKVNDVHDIVYAIDFNHKKEMILSGCSMMDLGLGSVRPGLVITSAGSSLGASSPSALRDAVLQTLRNDGNVLIPVDPSGRVLEILMILNAMWEEKRLMYPLLFVGPVVKATLEFARCQLEWMNEDLVKGLGHQQVDNPLALKRVTLCSTEKEAVRIMQQNRGPAVVLAVSDTLEDGPSRNFFARWAGNRRNTVIVLDPKQGSLAERIVQGTGRSKLKMTVSSRVPLQGEELKEYMENKATEKSEKDAVEEMAERDRAKVKRDNVKVIETKRDREPSSVAAAAVAAINADAMEEDGAEDGDGDDTECLIEGFELDEAAAFPMFPDEDDIERTLRTDEYGDIVDLSKLDPSSDPALSQALASEAAAERAPSDDEEDVPTKIERKEVSLQVQAHIEYLHFDGRSDSQSVQTMLTQMAPRSCVVVGGSQDMKAKLAATLVKDLEGLKSNVFVPDDEETVAVDLGSARSVIISDDLYQSMVMHTIGDVEMGWIDAELALDNQLIPARSSQKQGGIFIGDVKLSQLKRALAKASIASEFHAGGLYCQGDILVKRTDRGLAIEGQLSDQYYAIREVMYSQYHIC